MAPKIAIQIARNVSRSSKCQSITKSAIDKNLNASANSMNPKTTFTVFNHPPDFGKFPIILGNNAKITNGKANPTPKPNIAIVNKVAPPSVDKTPPITAPNAGPVHENDTMIRVNAMKKIPAKPPLLDALSTLFANEEGIVISKAPKNEIAKTIKIMKKNIFKYGFVEIS